MIYKNVALNKLQSIAVWKLYFLFKHAWLSKKEELIKNFYAKINFKRSANDLVKKLKK